MLAAPADACFESMEPTGMKNACRGGILLQAEQIRPDRPALLSSCSRGAGGSPLSLPWHDPDRPRRDAHGDDARKPRLAGLNFNGGGRDVAGHS
jgi:hypothetical protein